MIIRPGRPLRPEEPVSEKELEDFLARHAEKEGKQGGEAADEHGRAEDRPCARAAPPPCQKAWAPRGINTLSRALTKGFDSATTLMQAANRPLAVVPSKRASIHKIRLDWSMKVVTEAKTQRPSRQLRRTASGTRFGRTWNRVRHSASQIPRPPPRPRRRSPGQSPPTIARQQPAQPGPRTG